jgi:hypothetical protein
MTRLLPVVVVQASAAAISATAAILGEGPVSKDLKNFGHLASIASLLR